MKKLLAIVVLGLLLSGNSYAEQFEAHVKNYYNSATSFYGFSKKNFDEAKNQAFEDCKKNAVEKNLDTNGCLLYALQSRTAWQTLTGQEYEEIFWDKEVAKFEKKIEEKKIADKTDKLKKGALDLRATLINIGLEIGNKYKYFLNDVDDTGDLTGHLRVKKSLYLGDLFYLKWESKSSNLFIYTLEDPNDGSLKDFTVNLDWKNLTAIVKDENDTTVYNGRIFKPNKLYAASEFDKLENYVEKPKKKKSKKKKPKEILDDDKVVPAGSGSGFFVSREGHIITNHHVIDECNTTKVSFKGNQIDARILAVDKTNDIAILKTNIKPNSIFPVSNEDVSLLEDVVVAGYPLGKKVSSAIKTHKGVVTALAGAGDNFSNFQTDATINAGNSGGPIMNQKGNIVGIAVATWVQKGVQGVHFGIKSSTLKTFASSNSLAFTQPNNKDLSNKDLGKLITEATVYLECHMTVANIKKMIAAANNRKAFFSEYQ